MRAGLFPAMPSRVEKSVDNLFTSAVLIMRFAHVPVINSAADIHTATRAESVSFISLAVLETL